MAESFADIKAFDILASNSSQDAAVEDPARHKIRFRPEDMYYDMSGEKLLVIFNHITFDGESRYYYKDSPKKRTGTEEDVSSLDSTFTKLGFTVTLHNNKPYEDLWNIMCELRDTDMSGVSCLCIVILTHGHAGGELCAYDRPYDFNDVLRLFQTHPGLAGKPKLFFVQACRGKQADPGHRIEIDGEGNRAFYTVPSHADFLVMRSTVEDYMSYRDVRGSWMIQELCKALMEYHDLLDILQIITLVQKAVAFGYATNIPSRKALSNKRQMPETTFTLTKFVKL